MEKLILLMSIVCFVSSFFFIVAKMKGVGFFQIVFRICGIFGTALPFIYWLKLAAII